jgi:xanthine/uracil permease
MVNNHSQWYYYLSYWIFAWFILYKINLINLNPFPIYIFVIIFVTFEFFYIFWKTKTSPQKNIKINKKVIITWITLALILDYIPIFFLKPEINQVSILFGLILGLIYIVFMNSRNIGVISHYFNSDKIRNKEFENYNAVTFLKEVFL